jgi:hypothetical protein
MYGFPRPSLPISLAVTTEGISLWRLLLPNHDQGDGRDIPRALGLEPACLL